MRLIHWLRSLRSKPAAVRRGPSRTAPIVRPGNHYQVLCDRSLERAS